MMPSDRYPNHQLLQFEQLNKHSKLSLTITQSIGLAAISSMLGGNNNPMLTNLINSAGGADSRGSSSSALENLLGRDTMEGLFKLTSVVPLRDISSLFCRTFSSILRVHYFHLRNQNLKKKDNKL